MGLESPEATWKAPGSRRSTGPGVQPLAPHPAWRPAHCAALSLWIWENNDRVEGGVKAMLWCYHHYLCFGDEEPRPPECTCLLPQLAVMGQYRTPHSSKPGAIHEVAGLETP